MFGWVVKYALHMKMESKVIQIPGETEEEIIFQQVNVIPNNISAIFSCSIYCDLCHE